MCDNLEVCPPTLVPSLTVHPNWHLISEKKYRRERRRKFACWHSAFSSVDSGCWVGLIGQTDDVWMMDFWVSITWWAYCTARYPLTCYRRLYQAQCLRCRLQTCKGVSIIFLENLLLLFSCSVMSDSLWPHGLQHARLPFPSISPRLCSSSSSLGLVMPSNHLILFHPLLLPSIFHSIRVFSNESALLIRWPKYWSFSIKVLVF